MHNHPHKEIPIRAKIEMLDDITQIIHCLHDGKREKGAPLLNDLKTRAMFFDETVQNDVLIFASQVEFQYDYDPWHKVTPDITQAADKLINDLGFTI